MITALILVLLVAFIVTISTLPRGIKYLSAIGLDVKDMGKKEQPMVPISGGVLVMIGFFIALLFFIFVKTALPTIKPLSRAPPVLRFVPPEIKLKDILHPHHFENARKGVP